MYNFFNIYILKTSLITSLYRLNHFIRCFKLLNALQQKSLYYSTQKLINTPAKILFNFICCYYNHSTGTINFNVD